MHENYNSTISDSIQEDIASELELPFTRAPYT